MGVGLIREVTTYVTGTKLVAADRLVLLLIAERAHDTTREAWPGAGWDLASIAGLTEKGLRDCLVRLARAGVDVRVAIGTKRDGSPLYTCRGRQATYRLPDLTSIAGATTPANTTSAPTNGGAPASNAGATAPASGSNGGAPADDPDPIGGAPAANGGAVAPNGGAPAPPYPSVPSTPSANKQASDPLDPERLLPPLDTIWRSLRGDTDPTITVDELKAIHRLIIDKRKPKNVLAYVNKIAQSANGFRDMLAEVRHVNTPTGVPPSGQSKHNDEVTSRITAMRMSGPWCEHGEAAATTCDGRPLCALCRRGMAQPSQSDRTTDPRVAHIVSQYRASLGREPTTAELITIATQATRLVAAGDSA